MEKKAILPNIFTALSLSCGLFVIFKMSMVQPGAASYQIVFSSVCVLLFAAFLDLMDGAIARAMKAESEFGCIFDSMSDAVSFGVAPAALVLKTHSCQPGTLLSFALTTGAMIYAISGVLRLVRYTVNSHEIQGDQKKMALAKANFTGLPIPAAASITTSTTLLLVTDEFTTRFGITDDVRAIIAALVFVVIGFFMVSRWKFPSLKALHMRVSSFTVVALTAVVAVAILVGVWHHFPYVLAGIAWSYFILALLLSFVRLISGKKSSVLEDFEPEEEQEEGQQEGPK